MQVTCTIAACLTMAVIGCAPRRAAMPELPVLTRAGYRDALRACVTPLLERARSDSAFPGAYVIVGDSRGVLYEHGVGTIDWQPSIAPTRETMWDLASLTKVIATTTLAAQLVERGAIHPDSAVQRYLPGWTGPGKQRVTVRHLLTHTSGLPAFRPYDTLTHDPDSLAALLFATELERAPGERMVYSDIGAFVLGRVIEVMAGDPLDQLAHRRIFAPLDMRRTMFTPPDSLLADIAPTEVDTLRGGLVRGTVHDERAYYLGGVAAHAGLFSTASDLSRFATMMLHWGTLDGARILDSATIALFTRHADSLRSNRALGWQKPDRDGIPWQYPGSSWGGQYLSAAAYGHTGFTGTSIAVDPTRDLYIILLSNRVNPTRNNPRISAVRRELADRVVTAGACVDA